MSTAYIYLLVAVLLLLLEAMVSMVEASFFSVPRLALKRLRHELEGRRMGQAAADVRLKRVASVEHSLKRPSLLLGAILVFDMLITVSLVSALTLFGMMLARRYGWPEAAVAAVGGLVVLVVILVAGEVLPKVMAVRQPLRYALALAPFSEVLQTALAPIAVLMERAANRLLSRARPQPFPTRNELATMIEIGKEQGVIRGEEEAILARLVELDERTVSEIMTPRIAMTAVERGQTVRQATELACAAHRSRIPVYDRTVDRITGIYYVKDYFAQDDDSAAVGSKAREAHFVPEVKPVSALLEEFRRQAAHMAIVIDEFGQTAGLVTLEDALESIFGEIRDEYDQSQPSPWTRIDAGTYVVEGDIDLKTLNRLFRNSFRGAGFERLSALIHHLLGHLPEAGETLEYRNLVLEVQQVAGNAIERVLIRRKARQE